MEPHPLTLRPEHTVQEAAALFWKHHVDSAPVVDEEDNLRGLFTSRQIYQLVGQKLDLSVTLDKVMIHSPRTGSISDRIEEHLDPYPVFEHLPIVDGESLVGFISFRELGRAFFDSYHEISSEFDTIINSTHNLIASVDRNGLIRVFNKACEKFFGVKAEQVIGTPLKELAPNSGLAEIARSGKEEAVQKVQVNEHRFISNRSPILKDCEIIGAVAVLQDISELEDIAGELERYKSLLKELEKIIEFSFDGLCITDGEGTIIRLNEAFERITGNRRSDLMFRNMWDIEREGIVSKSVTRVVLELKEAATIIQESFNGRITLTTGNPIFDENGNIFRVVTNVRDLTELERLRKKIEEVEDLSQHYENELRNLRLQYAGSEQIVVNSEQMKDLVSTAMRLAQFDSTVLITGESGTGKELIANIIHDNSSRKNGPFIKVNCGAIPANLLESELFGYDYGAFTGAKKGGKAGFFQMANGGTIFLDEIGDMPYNLQSKILRVLQNREVVRVGGEKALPIDVRVIAATNRSLEEMVENKEFREDLYYRLNVVPVWIPPLRARKEDIAPLVSHFAAHFNKKNNTSKTISPEVLESLLAYEWPGNVRELQNLVENLMVTTVGNLISRRNLPKIFINQNFEDSDIYVGGIMPLHEAVEIVEKQILEKAYSKYSSTRQMAKALKVSAATIVRKASRYGIAK